MLRIDIHQEKQGASLILAGKLMGPWVTELERCWNALLSAEPCSPALPILVDLSGVTFIDEKGKQLVVQMCQSGIRFAGTGLIARFFCREIEEETRKGETAEGNL
jgi:hypothetical protein